MNSELMTFIITLSKLNVGFEYVDPSFISLQKFLELYKRKCNGIVKMSESFFEDFAIVELLELYVLQRCDSEENTSKFLDELRNFTFYTTSELDEIKEDNEEFTSEDRNYGEFENFANAFLSFEFPKEDIANWYMKLLKANPVFMQNSRIFNDERMNNLFSSEQIIDVGLSMVKKMQKKPQPRIIMGCCFAAMLLINLFSLNFSSITLMLIAGAVSLSLFIAKGVPATKGGAEK